MRYLVFPKEALREGSIRTSEDFPTIVTTMEKYPFQTYTALSIMRKVFKHEPFEPSHGKQYCIVPVTIDAQVATFRKRRPIPPPKEYTVEVSRF